MKKILFIFVVLFNINILWALAPVSQFNNGGVKTREDILFNLEEIQKIIKQGNYEERRYKKREIVLALAERADDEAIKILSQLDIYEETYEIIKKLNTKRLNYYLPSLYVLFTDLYESILCVSFEDRGEPCYENQLKVIIYITR